METVGKRLAILLLLVAFAAGAAEEPEVVYGKFHRAIATGNLDELLKHAPAARRAEMAGMSDAQKDAQIKMLSMMLPKAFTLMSKSVAPNGQSARLVVTGPGQPIIQGARPETMYGNVKMIVEGGEWKVDELAWSNERPAGVMPANPPQTKIVDPKPAPAKPAAKAAAPVSSAPVLGPAKAECVYKPVMTDEDMKRCR